MNNYYDNAVDEKLWMQIDMIQSRIDYLHNEIKEWEETEQYEACAHLHKIKSLLESAIEAKLLSLVDE